MGIEQGGGQPMGGPDIEGLLAKKELAQRQREEMDKKIDGVQKEVRIIKGLICDPVTGICRLPTKKEVAEMNQPIRDEVKKLTGAFESASAEAESRAKAKEKPRGVLGTAHPTKKEVRECPECQTQLVDDFLGPIGLAKAAEKLSQPKACRGLTPEQCKCLLTGICNNMTSEQKKAVEGTGFRIPSKTKEEQPYSFLQPSTRK